MANIPKYPQFSEPDNLNQTFSEVLPKCYCESLENLRIDNFKIVKALKTRTTGQTWSFYQFKNNEDVKKYVVHSHIYSGLYYGNDNDLIFGPYDGVIDTQEDLNKYRELISSVTYADDKFRKQIKEINNLTNPKLKEKCTELNLKKIGCKD